MRSLVLLSLLLVACGGKVAGDPSLDSDAAVDSARPDGGPIFDAAPRPDTRPTPVDAGPPPPPPTCATPLSSGFACVPPTPKKGQTVCTEEAIKAIVGGCFGDSATESTCNSARKKYPACDNCMLRDWLDNNRLDVAACVLGVTPGNPCAKTIKCGYDCLDDVCSSCDPTPGTGTGGGYSEMDDCFNNESEPTGKCYAIAMKDYMECAGDPKLSICFPATVEDVFPFFRGACRDGGDWSKSSSP